ncbi:uncharacterized protein L199_000678 [Kwoniella botswanensis]|uniref:uncharacterized protein n=1 Tax=Kwoniella botswanensis TaxID=1268659 RepID=UPI00315C8E47
MTDNVGLDWTKDPEEVKMHPIHHHENGDKVTLASNEGMSFGVDVRCLTRASTMFQDMFDLSTSHPNDHPTTTKNSTNIFGSREPIDIDARSAVLEHFIDAIIVSKPHTPPSDFDDTADLLTLCHQFDVLTDIVGPIRQRLLDLGQDQPWKLLRWAAHRNDRPIGQAALQSMSWTTFLRGDVNSASSFWTSIQSLAPNWGLKILSTALSRPTKGTVEHAVLREFTSKKGRQYTKWVMEAQTENVFPLVEGDFGGLWDGFNEDDW